MNEIMNYVKPELLVVSIVLYFIGSALKQSKTIQDKFIPLVLGGTGIVLCGIWVLSTCDITGGRSIAGAIFAALTQGVLVAGLSTYVNQIIKQMNKSE